MRWRRQSAYCRCVAHGRQESWGFAFTCGAGKEQGSGSWRDVQVQGVCVNLCAVSACNCSSMCKYGWGNDFDRLCESPKLAPLLARLGRSSARCNHWNVEALRHRGKPNEVGSKNTGCNGSGKHSTHQPLQVSQS